MHDGSKNDAPARRAADRLRRALGGGAAGAPRLLLLLLAAPLAFGLLNVTYRDAGMVHFPVRAAVQRALRAGEFPFVLEEAACGQPLAGNPNWGFFLPDTPLLFVLPLPVAYGVHFALALLLGYWGARRWARAEGADRFAAECAAAAFVGTGIFLSAWSFYNAGWALALAPAALAAAAKLRRNAERDAAAARRSAVELACCFALLFCAGEPVVFFAAAGAAALRVLLPAGTARLRLRAAALFALGGAIGGLLAAPQLATSWQAYAFSARGGVVYDFENVAHWSSPPSALLEQAAPFPFGRVDLRDARGFAAQAANDGREPYFLSLHLGFAALALAALFLRRRDFGLWAWLAAAGALFSFGSHLPGARALLWALSLGGRLRYPAKGWNLVALAVVPLVAAAAARWSAGERPSARRTALVAAGVGALAAAGLAAAPFDVWRLVATIVALGAAAFFVVAARRGARPAAGVVAATLLVAGLAAAYPLLAAVVDRPLDVPPFDARGGRIFVVRRTHLHPPPGVDDFGHEPTRVYMRRGAAELWPHVGGARGVPYAFDPDVDGSHSKLSAVVGTRVEALDWARRAPELRLAGVSFVVTDENELPPPYRPLAALRPDGAAHLFALDGAAPRVRAATRVWRAPDLAAVYAAHQDPAFDPRSDVALPSTTGGVEGTAAPARIVAARERNGSLEAEVEASAPAVVVWSRAFQPAYHAEVDGAAAVVVPAEGHLIGVRVPAGRHEVRIVWSRVPLDCGLAAAALGLAAALLLVRSGRRGAEGGR